MERLKKFATLPAALGLMLGAGVLAGGASLAAAQSSGTTTASQTQIQSQNATMPQFDPAKGGHIGSNGTKEELLTGDLATKATQAALVANPGATVQRVETDAEGASYEAHIVKADGTMASVKFDSNFNVTSTETGGPGGPGGPGQRGGAQQNGTNQ